MKVAPRQISSFLNSIPKNIRAVLLHGSDLGLISERAKEIAGQISTDLDDVFSVTRLDGDRVSSQPSLIADSADQLAMTAQHRLVWVKGRGTELLEACKLALARQSEHSFIIVEAVDTTTRHALVKLFDTADQAASIGCYPDAAGDIAALLTEVMARDRIQIDADTKAFIVGRIGSDRAASRRELEKLALLAGPDGVLSYDDVRDALGDSASLAITDIAIAAAEGQIDKLEHSIAKAWAENHNAIMLIRGCQGFFKQLLSAARASKSGTPLVQAVKSLRPPVHFKLQDRLIAQLRFWSSETLLDAVNRLQDAELAIKTGVPDDETHCAQTLLGVCLRGRALRR